MVDNVMNDNPPAFIPDASIAWQEMGAGVRRKIMSYDKRVMLVKVAFEAGAVGTLHHHYHTQLSYVSAGAFEVEIDGTKKVLKTGDVFHVAPNLVHGVLCVEAGELIDVFGPYREDFVGTDE